MPSTPVNPRSKNFSSTSGSRSRRDRSPTCWSKSKSSSTSKKRACIKLACTVALGSTSTTPACGWMGSINIPKSSVIHCTRLTWPLKVRIVWQCWKRCSMGRSCGSAWMRWPMLGSLKLPSRPRPWLPSSNGLRLKIWIEKPSPPCWMSICPPLALNTDVISWRPPPSVLIKPNKSSL